MAFDDDNFYGWKPYVSIEMRGARTARALLALKKSGATISPVVIDGRRIACTFWGKAWCENLERYSDFANRLPRGRSYLRNRAVVDLQITPGAVVAMVSGSALYRVQVDVATVPRARWSAICGDCAGQIDSVVALLQGRLSERTMARLCEQQTGLFPSPREIAFTCSCPDWASMCKHVAAVLYGIGARLDAEPELLFVLRKVDQLDLVASVGARVGRGATPASGRVLDTENLSEMFGIEIDRAAIPANSPPAARRVRAASRPAASIGRDAEQSATPARTKPASSGKAKAKLAKQTKAVSQGQTVSAAGRASVAQRMKAYWAARRRRHGNE